jgi:beta propeller repeat protein
MNNIFPNKRAEAVTLILLAVALLGLAGTAAYFSRTGVDNQVTGLTVGADECGVLGSADATYTLNSDIQAGASCFNITADRVTLDCAGHSVVGAPQTGGSLIGLINITGVQGVTVKNCRLLNSTVGIYALSAKRLTIVNNELKNFTGALGSMTASGIRFSYVNDSTISYNNISNSTVGILFYSSSPGNNNNTVIGNILENGYGTGGTPYDDDDIRRAGFISPILNNFYLNAFYGNGSDFLEPSFCVNGQGNFYRQEHNAPYSYPLTVESSDCGALNIAAPSANQHFYNVSYVNISWKRQDAPYQDQVLYSVVVYNSTLESPFYETYYGPTNFTQWDTTGVFKNSSFGVSITSEESRFLGSDDDTDWFTVTNDKDYDGYSVLPNRLVFGETYPGAFGGDCDEGNYTIHPPAERENRTNPEVANFCYDTVDDDCAGGIDWLDGGCGLGFNTGFGQISHNSFDPSMYINGSITDLDYTLGPVIRNDFGEIVYVGQTINLTGVDFSNIFDITRGKIVVYSDTVQGSKFNLPARISFFNTGFNKVPLVLYDGVLCPVTVCSGQEPAFESASYNLFRGNLSVNVAHFSNFSLANNSRLIIFDQNDSLGGWIQAETYHRLLFFANYTRADDGSPVNPHGFAGGDNLVNHNASCNISIMSYAGSVITSGKNMTYDSFSGLYYFESGLFDFNQSGTYRFNISCRSNFFEPHNLTDTIFVAVDSSPPMRPILYPQILLHPSNYTSGSWTYVAGYFNESDISVDLAVLHDIFSYAFQTNSTSSIAYSIFKAQSPVITHDALKGENVTFVNWSKANENLFRSFKYVVFSNHDRQYFYRYAITRANRTGDDLRVEFNESFEQDIPMGSVAYLYNNPVPSGWFRVNVSLFSGVNRITVWGTDSAGNEGPSSKDYINTPYGPGIPPIPQLWTLPSVIENAADLYVVGFINATLLTDLTMIIVNRQGSDFINTTTGNKFYDTRLNGTSVVTQSMPSNGSYVFINESDYGLFSPSAWLTTYVAFSNHDRTYWMNYKVMGIENYPGEDPRLHLSPNLESAVPAGTVVRIYNDSRRFGWFNITVQNAWLFNGTDEIYAVGNNTNGEGLPSASQFVFKNYGIPVFDLSAIPNATEASVLQISFNITDLYRLNLSTLRVNVTNSSGKPVYYAYDPVFFSSLSPFGDNISCSLLNVNGSFVNCVVNVTLFNGSNRLNFTVENTVHNVGTASKNITTVLTSPSILSVNDLDDLSQQLFLYANWTVGGDPSLVSNYEVALGTAQYPSSGYNSEFDFTGTALNRFVNVTHPKNSSVFTLKLMAGTVYYFNVRLKNIAGGYSAVKSSDGILFSDPSVPVCLGGNGVCVVDDGAWSNSNNSLHALWNFSDNESDIIEYTYAIGTAVYPVPGFESAFTRTTTPSASITKTGLSLAEGQTYYWSVRARNGNSAMNLTGSYSDYFGSNGITVDTTPPTNGSIYYAEVNTSANSTLVTYYTGHDNASGVGYVSGISSAVILVGKTPISPGPALVCAPIVDYDMLTNVTFGFSSVDVNLTHGYCHSFRLRVRDNAGNSRDFTTGNITKVVASDQTPPTTVVTVSDDGFFTYSSSSLHAAWSTSSDTETGIHHYFYRILVDDPDDALDCAANPPAGCPQAYDAGNGSTTQTEISLSGLNLTHGLKYYFEVTPVNGFFIEGARSFSDGIIYIDNQPPDPVTILSVNNDSTNYYLATVQGGPINISAIGEPSIDCVLMKYDLDFTKDSSVASDCSESNMLYNGSLVSNITCGNSTFGLQGLFTWYVSCRDSVGNAQTFNQNKHVEFMVDWPEPPWMNASFLTLGRSPLYVADTVFCNATLYDPDQDLTGYNAGFNWTQNGVTFRFTTGSNITTPFDASRNVSSDSFNVAAAGLHRGSNISCTAMVMDDTGRSNSTSAWVIVNNTVPSGTMLTYPLGDSLRGNLSFQWFGPSYSGVSDSDADGDYITYEIQVDDEQSFNSSDDGSVTFENFTRLAISEDQNYPSVYGDIFVFQDERNGNRDIYLYDVASGTEQQIATSTGDEIYPKVYGDYIIYWQNYSPSDYDLYMYKRSSGQRTFVAKKVAGADIWGSSIIYANSSGIAIYNISDGKSFVFNNSPSALYVEFYGDIVSWYDSGVSFFYDLRNGKMVNMSSVSWQAGLFNDRTIIHNDSGALFYFQGSGSRIITPYSVESAIYGDVVAYINGSSTYVLDLSMNSTQVISVGGSYVDIYDDLLVVGDGDDIYFARRNASLPFSAFAESPVSGSPLATIDTTKSPDGTYYWRVVACDGALGEVRCETSASQYFILDNTPPSLSVENPTPGKVTGGVVSILTTISDSGVGVSSASYFIQNRSNGVIVALDDLFPPLYDNSENFSSFLPSNLTLVVYASDYLNNTRMVSVDFVIDNNAPSADFGGLYDQVVVNSTILNTIRANNVYNSSLVMKGPLPSNAVVLLRSQTNSSISSQVLSDASNPIPISSLSDGTYYLVVNMSNALYSNSAETRRVILDRAHPSFSGNMTFPSGVVYANGSVILSSVWTDYTLSAVNFSYTNGTSSVKTESVSGTFLSSGALNSSQISLARMMGRFFYWNSTAIDGLNRTNSTLQMGFFVNDNLPYQNASLPNFTLLEDSSDVTLYLSGFFRDVNLEGELGYLDNLTYGVTEASPVSGIFVSVNRTTGLVNVSASGDFFGNVTVKFNVTDYYGGSVNSSNVTIVVLPVDDVPRNNMSIPNLTLTEDVASPDNLSLSAYFRDPDDSLVYGIYSTNSSELTVRVMVNSTTGNVSFYPKNNFTGVVFAVFNVSEFNSSHSAVSDAVLINVTAVNDPPSPASITSPAIASVVGGVVAVTWAPATDIDSADINYTLAYSFTNGLTSQVIASPIIGRLNNSYSWDTVSVVPDVSNLTLVINSTDGQYVILGVMSGNFTVDNAAPNISFLNPTNKTLVVGTSSFINVSTNELADCSFTLNRSVANLNQSSTYDVTSHVIALSGLAETHYIINASCLDSVGNKRFRTQEFDARSTSLSLEGATARPTILFKNQTVNITLDILSTVPVTGLAMSVNGTVPSASWKFNTGDFGPQVNEYNRLTFVVFSNTTAAGKYNLTNIIINGASVLGPLNMVDVFEVFDPINVTVITN